jgi:hypothetical protein
MRSSISAVRGHIAALRAALLSRSPEPIEECLPRLVEAVGCLSQMERQLRAECALDPESLKELKALKRDLRAVGKLIEHGAKFYQGWANLLSAATTGYTPAGEIAPLSASGTIWIRG